MELSNFYGVVISGCAFLIGIGIIAYIALNLHKFKQYVTMEDLNNLKEDLIKKIESSSDRQNERLEFHSNNCKHIIYISKQIEVQNKQIEKQNNNIEKLFDKIEELKNLFIDKLT